MPYFSSFLTPRKKTTVWGLTQREPRRLLSRRSSTSRGTRARPAGWLRCRAHARQVASARGTAPRQRDAEVQRLGKARMPVGCLRCSSGGSSGSASQPKGNLKLLKLFSHFLHCSFLSSHLRIPSGKQGSKCHASCGGCSSAQPGDAGKPGSFTGESTRVWKAHR